MCYVFMSDRLWPKTSMSVKLPEWLRNRHMIVFLQVHDVVGEGGDVGIFSKSVRDSASPPQPRGLVSGMYFPGTLRVWGYCANIAGTGASKQ